MEKCPRFNKSTLSFGKVPGDNLTVKTKDCFMGVIVSVKMRGVVLTDVFPVHFYSVGKSVHLTKTHPFSES